MVWRDEVLERIAERWVERSDGFGAPVVSPEDARQVAEEQWFHFDEAWRRIAPARFATCNPDDLDGPVREAFDEWRKDATRNVLIFGPVGTGKTYAAHAIARHAYLSGIQIQLTSMVDMLNDLRPGSDGRLSNYASPQLLLLDDLGAEKLTEWAAEQVNGLIDARWRDQLGTVVTSNLSPKLLKEQVGERAWSRLQDGAVAVTLTGPDRRRVAA